MQETFSSAVEKTNAGRKLDGGDPTVAARYKLNDIYCTAWLSHAITALVEHGIPDLIDETPISAQELSRRSNLHTPTLYRLLRALAANGIFREVPEQSFEHTEASKLLKRHHPYSWTGMSLMWGHPLCLQAWQHFRESVRDGHSGIEHAFGKTLYELLGESDELTKAFSDAMISNSAHPAKSIAAEFPFDKFHTVMDIGGGVGTLLLTILQTHRHLKGIILELPELEQHANENIRHNGMQNQCKFLSGNFLNEVPPGADLYLIKNSLWNWPDGKCNTILRNIRQAIAGSDARFLLIEYIINSQNAGWTTAYDLQILNMTGGRARTDTEYQKLLSEAGFVIEDSKIVEDQSLLLASIR